VSIQGLLINATSVGAGNAVQPAPGTSDHSYDIAITGSPIAVTVTLEGTIDGQNWVALDTHVMTAGELLAGYALVFVTGKPVGLVRGNLTLLTGGANPEVSMYYGQGA